MTPRVTGILLMVVSVAVGVLAGTLFAVPWWQISAALMLTVATVGMTVGLLWLFRKGWEDKAWPPGGETKRPNARKSALRWGIVLLALAPAFLALAVWAAIDGAEPALTIRVGLMFAGYVLFGILLVRFARRRMPEIAEDDEFPDEPDDTAIADLPTDSDGWIAMGRRDWSLALTFVGPAAFYVLLFPSGVRDSLFWLVMVAAALVVAAVAGFFFARSRANVVWVDARGRRVRVGRRTFDWSEIDAAQLTVSALTEDAPRTLTLVLRGPSRARVPVVLRRKNGQRATRGEVALALRMIEASRIEIPVAPEDPRGKFAHINFPGFVDRELALDLVRNPPRQGDPLPVPLG